jgi:GDSL-like Lipase/Acylhydrolase family
VTDHATHVVLLGDSIFDNAAYVPDGPDVVRQLRQTLPEGCRATLLAVDGAVAGDVARQLSRLPGDASLLVVSAGGNDALGEAWLLRERAGTIGEAVARLRIAQQQFASRYETMVEAVTAVGPPAALCTIYDTAFPQPEGPVITAALSLFNDVITRAAFARGLPLIDLRLICDGPGDYANPIEPSVQGGAKIAAAIAALAAGARAEERSVVVAE